GAEVAQVPGAFGQPAVQRDDAVGVAGHDGPQVHGAAVREHHVGLPAARVVERVRLGGPGGTVGAFGAVGVVGVNGAVGAGGVVGLVGVVGVVSAVCGLLGHGQSLTQSR